MCRYQSIQRNGPSGPQNEGLPRESPRSSFRRDKPQYVTIRRERYHFLSIKNNISYIKILFNMCLYNTTGFHN